MNYILHVCADTVTVLSSPLWPAVHISLSLPHFIHHGFCGPLMESTHGCESWSGGDIASGVLDHATGVTIQASPSHIYH